MSNTLGDFCCVLCGIGCSFIVAAAFPITQITLGTVYLNECPAGPAIPIYVLVSGVVALLVIGQFAAHKAVSPSLLDSKIWTLWIFLLGLFTLIWFIYGSYHIYVIYQPSYTKITIDPKDLNNSAYNPTSDNTNPYFENQNKTVMRINQTWVIDSNQTFLNLTETSLGNVSSESDEEYPIVARMGRVMAVAPYCHKTLYLFAFWTTTIVYILAAIGLVMTVCTFGCLKLATVLSNLVVPE